MQRAKSQKKRKSDDVETVQKNTSKKRVGTSVHVDRDTVEDLVIEEMKRITTKNSWLKVQFVLHGCIGHILGKLK